MAGLQYLTGLMWRGCSTLLWDWLRAGLRAGRFFEGAGRQVSARQDREGRAVASALKEPRQTCLANVAAPPGILVVTKVPWGVVRLGEPGSPELGYTSLLCGSAHMGAICRRSTAGSSVLLATSSARQVLYIARK